MTDYNPNNPPPSGSTYDQSANKGNLDIVRARLADEERLRTVTWLLGFRSVMRSQGHDAAAKVLKIAADGIQNGEHLE